ncbi:MAG: hypothetical protein COA96_10860 [SAR86 cluster bacterium]|uniref:DUF2059 domain-containing protein n=1 Tax=SAR86 cluster bacterium TaxID=2030880 RepID=A0A2A5AX82_9GAMM|nr:MAG: hypothetical protein COA96_10860 [SAR86 cluster bacterium]
MRTNGKFSQQLAGFKLLRLCIALLMFALVTPVLADSANSRAYQDAKRLLRVTDTGRQFESMALQQTRNIVRTYSSIVSMSAAASLPQHIKNSIFDCYAEAYAWDKFESGIEKIFVDNFSQKEMRLLIDFYRNRGVSPTDIQSFKDTIAKGKQIRLMSTEYILANSDGCVDRDAELILNYLYNRQRLATSLAAE